MTAKFPVLLAIMDGYGLGDGGASDAISAAHTPNIDALMARYPHTTLGASGPDVGLPEGQIGNSEVGHLNIGAGRVVYQELTRIDRAVASGELYSNEVLTKTFSEAAQNGGEVHIMGLMSTGGVHSSMEHAVALITMAQSLGVPNIYVHAFTDGRDVDPVSGAAFVKRIDETCRLLDSQGTSHVSLASVVGRYWAMDRDTRWERIKRAYDLIAYAQGTKVTDFAAAMEARYKDDTTDEFMEPLCAADYTGVQAPASIVFFNFRPDRARELTQAFTEEGFNGFNTGDCVVDHFVTLTEYNPQFNVEVAYPKVYPDNVLADVISDAGLRQLHTAETEKYAHVTFFFNGGREEPKKGETRLLVASPNVATYDLQPEMSAYEVTEGLEAAIRHDEADVYIVNYANCDMVGHTGDFAAAVKAVEVTDECVGRVVDLILSKGGSALITADHGNADCMFTQEGAQRNPLTAHTLARVPLIVAAQDTELATLPRLGKLCDVAPTILALAGVDIPEKWEGLSLI